MNSIKEFHLVRLEDETGVSGTGIVARGVVLPSGAVCMEWVTFHSSICLYKNLADIEQIHGHNGKTILVMGPPLESEKPKRVRKKKLETSSDI